MLLVAATQIACEAGLRRTEAELQRGPGEFRLVPG